MDDHPPVIATARGEATPEFGPITHSPTESFSFVVRVDDADINDQLYARLLTGDPADRSSIGELANLPSAGDAANPERRIAEFQELRYCSFLSSAAGQVTIWVKVSDAPFTGAGDQTEGKSNEALWVLTCQ